MGGFATVAHMSTPHHRTRGMVPPVMSLPLSALSQAADPPRAPGGGAPAPPSASGSGAPAEACGSTLAPLGGVAEEEAGLGEAVVSEGERRTARSSAAA